MFAGVLVSSSDANHMSPPVMPEGPQEKDSCLARIGLAIVVAVVGFVVITLFIQFRIARASGAGLNRSQNLRTIAQAVALYEQSNHIAMATLPDWKRALIDSGYVVESVFESIDAENGAIEYLLMSRTAEQFVPGLSSCFAICEDPRSLDDPMKNLRVIFEGDPHADGCSRSEMPAYMQMRCQYLNLPYDPAVLKSAFPAAATDSK